MRVNWPFEGGDQWREMWGVGHRALRLTVQSHGLQLLSLSEQLEELLEEKADWLKPVKV